jgi:hypothetical protein
MESEDALSWESVPPLPLASRELLSVFDMAHRAQSAEKGLRSKVGELEKSLSSQNADMSRLKELTAILREWTGLVEESRWYQAPQCLARLRVLCAKAAALDIDKNA